MDPRDLRRGAGAGSEKKMEKKKGQEHLLPALKTKQNEKGEIERKSFRWFVPSASEA